MTFCRIMCLHHSVLRFGGKKTAFIAKKLLQEWRLEITFVNPFIQCPEHCCTVWDCRDPAESTGRCSLRWFTWFFTLHAAIWNTIVVLFRVKSMLSHYKSSDCGLIWLWIEIITVFKELWKTQALTYTFCYLSSFSPPPRFQSSQIEIISCLISVNLLLLLQQMGSRGGKL